jgi:hypothetical protein
MKKKPVLSHKEFKRDYEATANPKILAIRQQAEIVAKKIKKGLNA